MAGVVHKLLMLMIGSEETLGCNKIRQEVAQELRIGLGTGSWLRGMAVPVRK